MRERVAATCEVQAGVRVLRLWSADDGIFLGEDPAPGLCISPALQPELRLGLRMCRSLWGVASPPGEVGLGLPRGPGSSMLTRVLLQTQASPRLGNREHSKWLMFGVGSVF